MSSSNNDDVWSPKLTKLVIDTLLNRAEGIFLWVSFVLKGLEKTERFMVVATLEGFPVGLDATYTRILSCIPPKFRPLAVKLLRWDFVAQRPLNLLELAAATVLEPAPGDTQVQAIEQHIRVCGDILFVFPSKDARFVRFNHSSAKDFLLSSNQLVPSDLRDFQVNTVDAHAMVAKRCLTEIEAALQGLDGLRIQQKIRRKLTTLLKFRDIPAGAYHYHVSECKTSVYGLNMSTNLVGPTEPSCQFLRIPLPVVGPPIAEWRVA